MIKIGGPIYIKCDQCRLITEVDPDSLMYETYSYERSMGEEIEYIFQGDYECEKCHQCIQFSIRGYEYPVGAFNFSDSECDHGEFVDEPNVHIEYEFDDYYYDYAYDDYLFIEEQINNEKLRITSMSHRDFEYYVANLFERMGYSVKVTKATRDGGYDIIATKADPIPFTLLIECKHWSDSHPVDINIVRSVLGVQTSERVNKSVIVTSSKFTKDARRFAESQKDLMTLFDIDDLLRFSTGRFTNE